MKKIVFIALLVGLFINAYAQRKDLTVGLKGGYTNYYKSALYGIDVAYHLSDPLEVAFTGLINPNMPYGGNTLMVYSTNLDFRLYLLRTREWATGPALGGQYLIANNKTNEFGSHKALGFNLGWHIRANLTDNLKVNGGWRYTNAKDKNDNKTYYYPDVDMSYHFFYLGIAYTFELR